MNERERLPNRRRSESFVVEHDGLKSHVMIGRYPDNRIGEVFIETGPIGSSAWAIAHDAAVSLSVGLQYGVPIEVFRHAVLKRRDGHGASILGAALDIIEKIAA